MEQKNVTKYFILSSPKSNYCVSPEESDSASLKSKKKLLKHSMNMSNMRLKLEFYQINASKPQVSIDLFLHLLWSIDFKITDGISCLNLSY